MDQTDNARRIGRIIDSLPDATLVIDTRGMVVAWNRAMEEMTGVSAGDMLGRGDYAYAIPFYGEKRPILIDLVLMPEEDVDARYHMVQREGKTLVVDIYIPGFRGRGGWLWAKASPLYDETGKVIGAIESVRDITGRKRLEEAMAGSRKRLADIIEFLPDATMVIDTAGTMIAWNRAMVELTGVPSEEMVGKGDYAYAVPFYGEKRPILIDLVLMPEEDVDARYHMVQREGKTLVVDVYIPGFRGRGGWLWAKASPLYDETGKVVGAIESVRDITERRLMEEALARSKAELDIAAEIQRSFLPQGVPVLPGFEIAARNVMAKEVGGDFFDVIPFELIPLSKEHLGLLVADVSGKGIPAALFMALSRIVIRVHSLLSPDPAEAIGQANTMITRDSHSGMFVTAFYGILSGGEKTLQYVNAGHNPPMIYRRKTGTIEELPRTGMALGVVEDEAYQAKTIRFESGDTALIYTDGITDAMNTGGEFFSVERLSSLFRANANRPAGVILETILDEVTDFMGEQPQFDDITLMVITAGNDRK